MLLLLLCMLCMVNGVLSTCDPNNGPAGSIFCIKASQYFNQYQWATCLTDAYIQAKSGNRHRCINRNARYCYYQCMLESFERSSGTVNRDCSCSPGDNPTNRNIPSYCLSPSGKDCNWYRNCLEKKYSCQDTTNAYAIRYAERFCNMFEQNKLLFSLKAQQWIDAVRKCLEVSLVPTLRQWRSLSCLDIRQEALQSHTKCYTSVCNLDCSEFYKIFYAVKASFGRLDTAWGSFKSLWNLQDKCGLNCTRDWFTPQNNTILRMMKIEIEKIKSQSHQVSLPHQSDEQNRFADQVVTFIAKSLSWKSIIMDWMAYPGTTSTSLYVVLADKKALGIVKTSVPSVNFKDTISGLVLAIKNSTIPVQVDGSNVWLKSLESCSDKTCSQPQSLAISEKPPVFPSDGRMLKKSGLLVVTSFLINSLVLWWFNNPF